MPQHFDKFPATAQPSDADCTALIAHAILAGAERCVAALLVVGSQAREVALLDHPIAEEPQQGRAAPQPLVEDSTTDRSKRARIWSPAPAQCLHHTQALAGRLAVAQPEGGVSPTRSGRLDPNQMLSSLSVRGSDKRGPLAKTS
eukprot:scaffold134770_cov33-Tisochrysis_lutea.AAC.3